MARRVKWSKNYRWEFFRMQVIFSRQKFRGKAIQKPEASTNNRLKWFKQAEQHIFRAQLEHKQKQVCTNRCLAWDKQITRNLLTTNHSYQRAKMIVSIRWVECHRLLTGQMVIKANFRSQSARRFPVQVLLGPCLGLQAYQSRVVQNSSQRERRPLSRIISQTLERTRFHSQASMHPTQTSNITTSIVRERATSRSLVRSRSRA